MIEELILVILVVVAAAFYFQFSSTPRPVSSTAAAAPARPAAAKKAAGVASRDLTILYGTQTGTAATFARTLAKDCTRNGLNVAAFDADEYDKHDLEAERLVLFVVATYGEGEAPDPMKPFYDWLLDTDGAGALELSSLKFGVFALGDRGYAHFCEVGKRVDSRMRELGATALLPLRCGDAGSDLEVEFDTWRCEAVAAVCVQLGRAVKGEGDEPVEPECFLRVLAGEKAPAYPFPKAADSLEPTSKQPAFVPVKAVTQLLNVPSDDKEQRSTLHITFEIKGTALTYQGGDHLGVMPRNTDALIESYLDHLKVDADMRDTLVALADAKTQKNQLPAWVTVRDCLRWHLDLAGRPKRSVLRVFAHYCTDATEKATMLAALGNSAAGLEQWHHLESKGRTVLGVLGLFPSCAVPLAHFIEAMPRLQARWFSIASDQLRTPHEVSICVAILQGGVCTQMLAAMKAGDVQPLFVRKSNFHLPMRDKARPIVCIGPGTGVAPLIGFMRRREAWAERKQALGPCHLFFGCRNKTEDWLYSEDMRAWHEGKTIVSDLHVAFSRESAEKVYVQHLLAKEGPAIWDAVSKRNANIYICGDAKHMAKDVQATLEEMAQKQGGMSAADASAYFTKLEVDKRIFKDVWSS